MLKQCYRETVIPTIIQARLQKDKKHTYRLKYGAINCKNKLRNQDQTLH